MVYGYVCEGLLSVAGKTHLLWVATFPVQGGVEKERELLSTGIHARVKAPLSAPDWK